MTADAKGRIRTLFDSKEVGKQRYNAQQMSEILIAEAKTNWTNRIAVAVEAVKAVISGLTADKKSKHKQLAQQQQSQQVISSMSKSTSTPMAVVRTATTHVDDDAVEEVSPTVAEIIRNEVGRCIDLFLDEELSEENDAEDADKDGAF
jgi:hypothetical protein